MYILLNLGYIVPVFMKMVQLVYFLDLFPSINLYL